MKRVKAKKELFFDELARRYMPYRQRQDGTCRNLSKKGEYCFLLYGKERVDYSLLKRIYP